MPVIKLLVMDVDGTLTDGKICMGNDGEMLKTFDIKDGYAIHTMLREYDILPVIITGRTSKIVANRANELGIKEIYQGVSDKLAKLQEVLMKRTEEQGIFYSFKNVAYIGDDLNDIPCMESVKESSGMVGCPLDAVEKVKSIAAFISNKNGGEGAVREFIEYIIKNNEEYFYEG